MRSNQSLHRWSEPDGRERLPALVFEIEPSGKAVQGLQTVFHRAEVDDCLPPLAVG